MGSGDRGRALGNEGKLSLGVGNWQGNIQSKQGPHSPGPPEKVDQEVFRSRPVILNSPACGFLILVFNAVASLPYQTTAFMEYNVDVMTRMHPQFSQHLIIIPPRSYAFLALLSSFCFASKRRLANTVTSRRGIYWPQRWANRHLKH